MNSIKQTQAYSPPRAIAYVRRKSRVSDLQAHLIATLAGFSLPDDWQHIATESARVVNAAAWRAA